MLNQNKGQEAQIKVKVKRSAIIIGQNWGIGKRSYGGDWEKRI